MNQEKWFSKSGEDVAKFFETDMIKGLSSEQVEEKRSVYGTNEIVSKNKKSIAKMILEQFQDFMIIILIIAAVISGVVGQSNGEGFTDSIIILVIVILNAVIGVIQELKAQKSLESLKNLSAPHSKVIRDGKLQDLESKYLVPGDIVVLETGDYVPADLRLIEAVNLKTQEAALTGESLPVEKTTEKIDKEDIGIGDRLNQAFSSSLVTYGRGKGIVVSIGMQTEVGKIATMLDSVDDSETPLSRRLEALGKTLGIAALVICLVIFAVGSFVHGREIFEMFMTAVSLAVAAIPEGLPAISTIVLSIGVQRMVKRNAIIRTLPSVETLGSATVICSDKTGTLTQNKMTVEKIFYNNEIFGVEEKKYNVDDHLRLLMNSMILCNDTKVTKDGEEFKLAGDPTETALVDLGIKLNMLKTTMDDENPRVEEIPFDSERKLMSTVNNTNQGLFVYTKGGVDEILSKCSKIYLDNQEMALSAENINYIKQVNEEMAKGALRVLAMAYKRVDKVPTRNEMNNLESELVYIGMVGMIDPARPEAKEAVEKCKTAGIKPVMITGDHKTTAVAIAEKIGIYSKGDIALTGAQLDEISNEQLAEKIDKISVYARVSPEHKIRIVDAWQKKGRIAAMTGDGVNDAPALKKADVGVAMGITGTEVAKDAAAMVLSDDNFATIIKAVANGRNVYRNIKNAILFLLSGNTAAILCVLYTSIMALPVPFAPVHLLFINLLTDSLPALAIGMEPADPGLLKNKPRDPSEGILTKDFLAKMFSQGALIAAVTMCAYYIGYSQNAAMASTMAFSVLTLARLFHGFNCRRKESIFKIGFLSNKYSIGAFIAGTFLLLVVLFVPVMSSVFSVSTLTTGNMVKILGLAFIPTAVIQIVKMIGEGRK